MLEEIRCLCRAYVDTQKERIAEELRLQKYEERGYPESVLNIYRERAKRLKKEEKDIVKRVKELIKDFRIYKFCERVKGLGATSAMLFIGFVDIQKATSAGKVKKYAGMTPDSQYIKGQKLGFNPDAKRFFWLMGRNVIMKKDEYYYPMYQAKKEYYWETRKFKEVAKDPKKCPRYEECRKRLKRATRPACKAHVDAMAKRWLNGLLISHLWELYRLDMGLPINKHRMHIPPKPEDPEHMEAVLKLVVPALKRGEVLPYDLSDKKVAIELASSL